MHLNTTKNQRCYIENRKEHTFEKERWLGYQNQSN
jgi:hypothetical protein